MIYVVLRYCMIWYCIILYHTTLRIIIYYTYYTVLYCIVLYYIIHRTFLYLTILYFTRFYRIILQYIISYYSRLNIIILCVYIYNISLYHLILCHYVTLYHLISYHIILCCTVDIVYYTESWDRHLSESCKNAHVSGRIFSTLIHSTEAACHIVLDLGRNLSTKAICLWCLKNFHDIFFDASLATNSTSLMSNDQASRLLDGSLEQN